jgi:predicted dehydrogenase
MTFSQQLPATADQGDADTVEIAYRRVALVGCGQRFAVSVAPTLAQAKALVVLAADPDPEARSKVASMALCASDLILAASLSRQQLIEADAQAIIISSPSGLHFEHCMIALSCGLPTFVEKPIACTTPHAAALQVASQGRLVASEQRVYREDLGYVRSVIESGVLGEISELNYHDSIIPAPHFNRTWRNDPQLAGGGVLLDLGYHTVGCVQWLLGLKSGDLVVTGARLTTSGLQVEDAAEVLCQVGDTKISLDIRLVRLAPREVIVIKGSRGELRMYRERRTRSAVADISFAVNGESPSHLAVPLEQRIDSKSLLDFLRGGTGADRLDRHIVVLELIEQAYEHSGFNPGQKGCAQCN